MGTTSSTRWGHLDLLATNVQPSSETDTLEGKLDALGIVVWDLELTSSGVEEEEDAAADTTTDTSTTHRALVQLLGGGGTGRIGEGGTMV